MNETTPLPYDSTFRSALQKRLGNYDLVLHHKPYETFTLTRLNITAAKAFSLEELASELQQAMVVVSPGFKLIRNYTRIEYHSRNAYLTLRWTDKADIDEARALVPYGVVDANSDSDMEEDRIQHRKPAYRAQRTADRPRATIQKPTATPVALAMSPVQQQKLEALPIPLQHMRALQQVCVAAHTFQGPKTPAKMGLRVDCAFVEKERRHRLCMHLRGVQECNADEIQTLLAFIKGQGKWMLVRELVVPQYRTIVITMDVCFGNPPAAK